MIEQTLPDNLSAAEQAFAAEPKFPSRRTRSSEHRESNPRPERPPINFGTGSQFNIPMELRLDTRKRFGWTPYILRNEEHHEKCDKAQDKGWMAAEAADYPSLVRAYKHRENDRERLVKRGGCLLQSRDEDICQQEDESNNEEMRHNAMISAMHVRENPMSACFDQRSGHNYMRQTTMNKNGPSHYGNPFNFGLNNAR